jgi:uncharacterized membrane protein
MLAVLGAFLAALFLYKYALAEPPIHHDALTLYFSFVFDISSTVILLCLRILLYTMIAEFTRIFCAALAKIHFISFLAFRF